MLAQQGLTQFPFRFTEVMTSVLAAEERIAA